jgi:hypothetical protein
MVLTVRNRCGRLARVVVLAGVVFVAFQGIVSAQVQPPKIGLFAIDARRVIARYGPTEEQAAAIGYEITDVPPRGWGYDVGAHVYPVRWRRVALGIGGNLLTSAGHSEPKNAKGVPTGREADTRFRSVASQVSVNFGSREGWSYLSAGFGYSTFAISNQAHPEPDTLPNRKTINFGAGARWTVRSRVALSLDLRFYRMSPPSESAGAPVDARTTRMVFGAGLSIK